MFLVGFPGVSVIKNPPASAGDSGDAWWTLGQKIPWRRNGNLLQYSCLAESRGQRSLAGYTVCGVTKSTRTERLSAHTLTRYTHTHVPHTHTFLVPLQLRGQRWLDAAEKIMSKGWTCLTQRLEGPRDTDSWESEPWRGKRREQSEG